MRITYLDGKLRLSLTKDEVKLVNDNIGRPVELPIGALKVLKEDVDAATLSHWSKVEVWRELRDYQRSQKSISKKKK